MTDQRDRRDNKSSMTYRHTDNSHSATLRTSASSDNQCKPNVSTALSNRVWRHTDQAPALHCVFVTSIAFCRLVWSSMVRRLNVLRRRRRFDHLVIKVTQRHIEEEVGATPITFTYWSSQSDSPIVISPGQTEAAGVTVFVIIIIIIIMALFKPESFSRRRFC